MREVKTIIVCIISLMWLSLLSPLDVWARAKKPTTANGCTVAQHQSNFGNSCIDQGVQDLINNRSYTHVLLCNGSGMLCCTMDNNATIINCRRPAGSRAMELTGTTVAPSGIGEIQTRGVEGADAADEETPVPEWITEERLKQVQKDLTAK